MSRPRAQKYRKELGKEYWSALTSLPLDLAFCAEKQYAEKRVMN